MRANNKHGEAVAVCIGRALRLNMEGATWSRSYVWLAPGAFSHRPSWMAGRGEIGQQRARWHFRQLQREAVLTGAITLSREQIEAWTCP